MSNGVVTISRKRRFGARSLDDGDWGLHALSCACAIAMTTPTAAIARVGPAARDGVLIRRPD